MSDRTVVIGNILLAAYLVYLLCFTSTHPLLIWILLIGALLCIASYKLPFGLSDGRFQTFSYALIAANCSLFLFIVNSAISYKIMLILSIYSPIFNIAVLFHRRKIRNHLNRLKISELLMHVGQETPHEAPPTKNCGGT